MTTEQDVVKAVSDLSESGAASERVALQSLGIGPNDAKVLRFLLDREDDDEPVTPRLLAEMLGISSAATTALIDRLADAGWVERVPFPGDRRSIVVRATIDAASPARHLLAVRRSSVAEAASRLGADERRVVAEFLDEVARAETQRVEHLNPRAGQSRPA
ncbi:MarR family winged helix-turn-helix transcriptional regulator [Microbacterium sp. NPDC016588]|uniref:MarR family winged helix-turn-helix transcriptional regulator n=1 Tax=Microbacterium TaxID=33882 RepID=UPI00097BF0AB|nr:MULTISPECIES: MarR family transcriptional regulator [unclassified Microbacterium]MBQ9917031.1 MarR family transcriptional regulator [Microbacterium sp.]MDI9891642.1 MarR family transcriptional regulator [Microbacterium sp. IEGM 1404]